VDHFAGATFICGRGVRVINRGAVAAVRQGREGGEMCPQSGI
jgi:hypothetical protein